MPDVAQPQGNPQVEPPQVLKSSSNSLSIKAILPVLLVLLLLLIIGAISYAIFSLNKSQNAPANKVEKTVYKPNPKYSDYAKKYLGGPRLDPKINQYAVSGILDGRTGTNEINIDTATGPLVIEINDHTLLEELSITTHTTNNSTDAATLKVAHVYTLDEFIKNVADGSFLRVNYTSDNDINTASKIDYIK